MKVPIRIVVDTREKEPYSFSSGGVEAARRKLEAGDYSLEGYESRVAVERKSLNDFVSTVIHHRSRFERELERLAGFEAACIVVEASLDDVLQGRYFSAAHPSSILGSTLWIIIDYGVPVFFCSDRPLACHFVEGYLRRFQRKMERETSGEKGE